MSKQNELRITGHAGVMIPRCPVKVSGKDGKQNCFGHQHVPVTIDEMIAMRFGHNKAVSAEFSCGHKTVEKIIIEA